tara:strand:- start:1007 stop:1489 length:483 start_codon:yes stop_codon:yes gene_type:complete
MGDVFKNDYLNMMPENELLAKYDISHTTYYRLLKRLNIKRDRATKINRLLGRNENKAILPQIKQPIVKKIIDKTNNIPETDLLDENLVYGKQYVPRNTDIEVNKTKPIIKFITKPITKPNVKSTPVLKIEEAKQDNTNNKSELINVINRTTKIREKILNK